MIQAALRYFGLAKPVPATFARETAAAEPHASRNGILTRPARGPVLMLDIDGVLHPAQSGSLIYLPILEAWLRQHPTVDVVVSSNWRDSHTFDELRNLFSDDLRERIIGTTPNLESAYREDEIMTLAREYAIVRWAALDDRPQEFPTTGQTRLIATEYFDGLAPAHLERLAQNLGLTAQC